MADAYTGAFTHIEEQTKDLLAADANLATASGTRVACATFEDEPRETERHYMEHELPAITCFCDMLSADEDVSTGGLVAVQFGLTVFVITEAAEQGQRMTLCKDIGARVITVLGSQYGADQLSGLDVLVPDAEAGSVFTTVLDATFDESGGGESELPYRAIGELLFGVRIDILR